MSAERGRTDLCERGRSSQEAESRWSAQVMNPWTWLVEAQLLFCVNKVYCLGILFLKQEKEATFILVPEEV